MRMRIILNLYNSKLYKLRALPDRSIPVYWHSLWRAHQGSCHCGRERSHTGVLPGARRCCPRTCPPCSTPAGRVQSWIPSSRRGTWDSSWLSGVTQLEGGRTPAFRPRSLPSFKAGASQEVEGEGKHSRSAVYSCSCLPLGRPAESAL